MPKVTVMNVPVDALPGAKTQGKATIPPRRVAWGSILSALRHTLAGMIKRDFWSLNILAFLLGRVVIMGELAPLGLAFFAAVAQTAKDRAPAAAVWALAGVVSSGRYTEGLIYLWAVLLYYRLADRLARLPKSLVGAPLIMFVAVTSGGFISLFWQPTTLYAVMLVFFEAAICATAAYVFAFGAPVVLGCARQEQDGASETIVCALIILAAAVAGLGNWAIWGYSLRNMAASLLAMSLAYGGGAGIGAAVGVAAGLVAGLTDGNVPADIAVYSLAGALAGLFRSLGRYAVILGYLLGAAISVLGFIQSRDVLQVLTEGAVAAAAFLAVPRKWTSLWSQTGSFLPVCEEKDAIRVATAKLNNISDMFQDLAGAFGQISAGTREKIREAELTRLLSAVGDRVCGHCTRRTVCWENEFYNTYQAMLEALGSAGNGRLTTGSLPPVLKENCLKRADIVETINLVAERNSSNLYWQKKLAESRQIVTEQLRAVASIIGNLAAEINEEPYVDKALSRDIQEKAGMIGCQLDAVWVTGEKGVSSVLVSKKPCSGSRECVNTILPLTANLLKQKLVLHADCGSHARTKCCRLTMRVANRFTVQTGFAAAAKQGGEVSGDTCSVVTLEQGKIVMMLSDGMGSGSSAAGESLAAVSFLERLMAAGFSVDAAVKTVNSLLLLRMPEESFATVDMVVLDAFSGEAEFLKIGSAPSFVKRVREVTVVRAANLPIGIMSQIEIQPIRLTLVPGDMIVMVSDGVSEAAQRGVDRDNWVANFLRRQSSCVPQELADRLLKQALELSGGKARDDMTVLTALVVERPEIGK
ncbi:MAG: stage II sporulation protein E [Negativicutes bacterium]|nr:stage II sporulation protein E [Negativicutes bacterium]